ncbi:U2 small nuclear ribonucleoprotein B [Scenedesmus sp. PABB004]|nr:U2 small nuclear ribonucleoprotein B [Scenedesmus sp. PABB004]
MPTRARAAQAHPAAGAGHNSADASCAGCAAAATRLASLEAQVVALARLVRAGQAAAAVSEAALVRRVEEQGSALAAAAEQPAREASAAAAAERDARLAALERQAAALREREAAAGEVVAAGGALAAALEATQATVAGLQAGLEQLQAQGAAARSHWQQAQEQLDGVLARVQGSVAQHCGAWAEELAAHEAVQQRCHADQAAGLAALRAELQQAQAAAAEAAAQLGALQAAWTQQQQSAASDHQQLGERLAGQERRLLRVVRHEAEGCLHQLELRLAAAQQRAQEDVAAVQRGVSAQLHELAAELKAALEGPRLAAAPSRAPELPAQGCTFREQQSSPAEGVASHKAGRSAAGDTRPAPPRGKAPGQRALDAAAQQDQHPRRGPGAARAASTRRTPPPAAAARVRRAGIESKAAGAERDNGRGRPQPSGAGDGRALRPQEVDVVLQLLSALHGSDGALLSAADRREQRTGMRRTPGPGGCLALALLLALAPPRSGAVKVPGGPRVEGALFVSPRTAGHVPAVTVRLHSPQGDQMWSQHNVQTEAHFNIAARGPGTYKVCLYSGFESHVDVVADLVYFTLGHLRRPGQVQVPKGTGETRGKDLASKDHLDDVRRNVMVVGELIDILSGEQKYLHRKLERHIKTVQSNNARTFWYTGLEVLVLLGVTIVNLAVTTGFFKGGPPGAMADIAPNQTIYINNLYEKLPKEELRKALYAMFSQFGKIIDVVALKTLRLRGQAWVVFSDVAAATNAKTAMQGFPFFDKPIRVSFAHTKSDAVAKLDGSFKPDKDRGKKSAAARDNLIKRSQAKAAGGGAAAGAAAGAGAADGAAPPHKILFATGLPEATTSGMLTLLFQQYPGFAEVRMVESRPGIAFVEFDSALSAGTAMAGLQGFKITPERAMTLTYAKQ